MALSPVADSDGICDQYDRAATIMLRAPGTDIVGVVDRSGLRNVNCMLSANPAAILDSSAAFARTRGSAVVTPTRSAPAFSTDCSKVSVYVLATDVTWRGVVDPVTTPPRLCAALVPKSRYEPTLCQHGKGAQFFVVEDHRVGLRLATQHRNDAVVACGSVAGHARITGDEQATGLLHLGVRNDGEGLRSAGG